LVTVNNSDIKSPALSPPTSPLRMRRARSNAHSAVTSLLRNHCRQVTTPQIPISGCLILLSPTLAQIPLPMLISHFLFFYLLFSLIIIFFDAKINFDFDMPSTWSISSVWNMALVATNSSLYSANVYNLAPTTSSTSVGYPFHFTKQTNKKIKQKKSKNRWRKCDK